MNFGMPVFKHKGVVDTDPEAMHFLRLIDELGISVEEASLLCGEFDIKFHKRDVVVLMEKVEDNNFTMAGEISAAEDALLNWHINSDKTEKNKVRAKIDEADSTCKILSDKI